MFLVVLLEWSLFTWKMFIQKIVDSIQNYGISKNMFKKEGDKRID